MAGSVTVLHTVLLSATLTQCPIINMTTEYTQIPKSHPCTISYLFFFNYSESEVFTIIHQVMISGAICSKYTPGIAKHIFSELKRWFLHIFIVNTSPWANILNRNLKIHLKPLRICTVVISLSLMNSSKMLYSASTPSSNLCRLLENCQDTNLYFALTWFPSTKGYFW